MEWCLHQRKELEDFAESTILGKKTLVTMIRDGQPPEMEGCDGADEKLSTRERQPQDSSEQVRKTVLVWQTREIPRVRAVLDLKE